MASRSEGTGARHRKIRDRDLRVKDIATAALPYLSTIRKEASGIRAIVLGTGDGIHICSLGMKGPQDAARLAALNSSMYGVAGAQVGLMGAASELGGETVVAVTMPGENLIVAGIDYPPLRNLLLCVSAEEVQLGMAIHQTRRAAADLSAWLADD